MGASVKTDNHDLAAKLELRRYFLRKYHAAGLIDVLDCCQGSGLLWGALRKEFSVTSYWGLDLKPKKGRLKLDSIRVLSQSGWPQNVVDVDTYGTPWKHWNALLPNLSRPTSVFLTWGMVRMHGGTALLKEIRQVLELGKMKLPPAFSMTLNKIGSQYLLGRGAETCKIMEAMEAVSDGNARYLGLHLVPRKVAP